MKQRIDEMVEGSSFNLDGVCHTIRSFENGRAVCERADGAILYINGWMCADDWEGRSFKNWFTSKLSAVTP